VRSTGLGAVLTDPSGKTLYLLTADTPTTAACTGGCLGIWMPLAAPSSGQPQAGSGVNVALGVFTRTDGTKQVTIGGHQLYTYSGDAAAGDTAGQGINSYGGIWYTVSSHGVAILGTSGGSSPTPTTGYGY
jgi:predicted lipoprotein with Yx(FWY)xxD motif